MNQKWSNNQIKELEIILELLKEKTYARDLSKKLNIPLTTILRILSLLLESNVVDYKQQGKNKVYELKENIDSIHFIKTAELYKLRKLLFIYPEISPIIEEIIKKSKSKLVLLFGSYAKFSANKNSDIDIYIETTNRKEKAQIEKINLKVNVKIGYFDKNNTLIKEIIKNHIILKGVDELYEKNYIFN